MRTPSALSLALELLASLVAPPRCAACDGPVEHLAAFCASCASTVDRAPRDDPTALAAFLYGGAVANAVSRMKYSSRPDLARPLGDLLWRAIAPHAPRLRDTVVVPVPLHPTRLAERGFNQSALLARRLAHHLGAEFAPLALVRRRDIPKQATLDRESRLENVRDAFAIRQVGRVRARAVLLVDDVCTTGATLAACAAALRGGGALEVATAVVARTP
jgi:ComF family protein